MLLYFFNDFTSSSSSSSFLPSSSSYPINFDFDHLVHFQVSDFQYTHDQRRPFLCENQIKVRAEKKIKHIHVFFVSFIPINQKQNKNKIIPWKKWVRVLKFSVTNEQKKKTKLNSIINYTSEHFFFVFSNLSIFNGGGKTKWLYHASHLMFFSEYNCCLVWFFLWKKKQGIYVHIFVKCEWLFDVMKVYWECIVLEFHHVSVFRMYACLSVWDEIFIYFHKLFEHLQS